MLTANHRHPCRGDGLLRDQCDPIAPGQRALSQTASTRASRSMDCLSCTGSCEGYVRQNEITSKYGLGFFLQVVQIQLYKIWANSYAYISACECANLKGKWVRESDVESHLEQCKH